MTAHGWERDDCPQLRERVMAADILVLGTPSGWASSPPFASASSRGSTETPRFSGGPENDFTQRNTTFMTWNLLHLARMFRDRGGIPARGNQRSALDAGCRFDHPNPEHR